MSSDVSAGRRPSAGARTHMEGLLRLSPRPGHSRDERLRLLRTERSVIPFAATTPTCVVCYPDTYAAGMASLGFQVVHRIFSSFPGWTVHRAFGTQEPYQRSLIRQKVGAGTLEGGISLSAGRVVAFSLPYSLLFKEMLALLDAGGIPATRERRSDRDPLVVAGGTAVTINPEPVAPFVDLVVLGEAEETLVDLEGPLRDWVGGGLDRTGFWKAASRIPGAYAPAVQHAAEVTRWRSPPMDSLLSVSSFVSPCAHFRDALLLEASRGCPGRCRFCVVGGLYRPVRWRSPEETVEMVVNAPLEPRRASLIGAAVSQHPRLLHIVGSLVGAGIEVGLSSLRVESYDEELARALTAGGVRTITMAPEAGTERMRSLIGKPLRHETLVRSVAIAARNGVSKVRLYFMVGLPWEREDDRQGIVQVCGELSSVVKGTPCAVVPSLAPFVPKPMTPFGRCEPADERELRATIRSMMSRLRELPSVRPRAGSPRLAQVDYRLSVGGHELAEPLLEMTHRRLSWRQWLRITEGMVAARACFPWGVAESSLNRQWDQARREAAAG
jgi:radical SAM superfamily enzyme YgiQ (UPF0313 family)